MGLIAIIFIALLIPIFIMLGAASMMAATFLEKPPHLKGFRKDFYNAQFGTLMLVAGFGLQLVLVVGLAT